MSSFAEFVANIKFYRHHALLLISKQFDGSGFPEQYFATLAKELCGIELFQNPSASIFEVAATHQDIFIADRQRKTLRLEELEKIKELIYYQPTEGIRRLIFIENCERMNANSANALLKALEEPQAKTIFVLTTKNKNSILPTIISRCQKVFLQFPDLPQTNFMLEILQQDLESITYQINNIKLTNPFLVLQNTKEISIKNLKKTIDLSENLAKEYPANVLQDAIVSITNERLKKEPSFLIIAKAILLQISDWKDNEVMNLSTQLWLTRIFTGLYYN